MFKSSLYAFFALVFSSSTFANFAVSTESNGISITPAINYTSAQLTLIGPDGRQQIDFNSGQTIVVPTPRQDGRYKFELVLSPLLSPAQQQALEAARNGQGEAPFIDPATTTYSQNFAVLDSQLILSTAETDPNKPETRDDGTVITGGQQTLDQVINDDLIVTFSACVGNDCANGEAFGFDTVRLKENNLRIHFDDTSATGSFPGNDWRLVANDTGNGGSNLFALEDSTAGRRVFTVEAGAPTNSLYVEQDGDVGINTANPVVELHVVDGDSPTLRLEQNGSVGFQAQTFDIVTNETNFFIRDVTNGSALPFRIQPGTATANTFKIDNEGQVAIGVANAAIEANATLHVRSRNIASQPAMLVEDSTGAALMSVADSGDMILAGTLAQLSREDSKEHFVPVDPKSLLAALKSLNISSWNYKHQSDDQRHLGPMAEAFYAAYGLGTDPEHIATSDMAAVALASSQALLLELEAKDQRINELETRLQQLETLMGKVLDRQDQQDTQQLVNR